MYIKQIYIDAFGGIKDLSLELSRGLNIIEGANESGKSSIAMFIKFVLYGLSGRAVGGSLSERRRYVNWETGSAKGYIILEKGGKDYRVSRELYVSGDAGENEAVRERVSITNEAMGEKVHSGEVPGMALLNMPEQMFYNSVFVRQLADIGIDGEGMNEAIENILYSGDEQVSCRRALDKLDKSRKALLHKNGNGGKIYDARREKIQLESALSECREKNAEIIELEGQLADSLALIERREAEAAHLGELLSAADKLKDLEKLAEIEELEAKASELRAKLAALPTVKDTEAAADEMRRTSAKRGETEFKLKSLRMSISNLNLTLPKKLSEEEIDDMRGDASAAKTANSKKKSRLIVSAVTAVLAVICGAAALFLKNTPTWVIAAAAAAVLFIVAIVFLILDMKAISTLNKLLAKWNAVDADDLDAIVENRIDENILLHSESSEIHRLTVEEKEVSAARDEIIAYQRTFAAKYTDDEPDTDTMTDKAIAKTADIVREINTLTAELGTIGGKLSILGCPDSEARKLIREEAIAARESDVGETAAAMTSVEKVKTERDRGFFLSTAEAQRKRHIELEKKLAALTGTFVSPAELASKLKNLDDDIIAMERTHKGLVGAMNAITAASENLRRSLMPRVVSEAGALLGEFTGGKYTGIGLSSDFELSYSPGGYSREADFMSAGTRDAAYISLRSALMRVLFEDDAPPAVYDESFARIDEDRLSRLLEILAGEKDIQSLVFTCRSLEAGLSRGIAPTVKL